MFELSKRKMRTKSSQPIPIRSDRPLPRPSYATNRVLANQQALANQAAQRFAQSCPLTLPSPHLCPFGGICHTCPSQIQADLKIGQPGDKFEDEADRVAEQVMRLSVQTFTEEEPRVSALSQIQQERKECTGKLRRQPLEEKERQRREEEILRQLEKLRQEEEIEQVREELFGSLPIQRSPAANQRQEQQQGRRVPDNTARGNVDLVARILGLRGRGRLLPQSVRTFFEPRFGYSLDQVRVHTDKKAAEMANALNARAFAIGNNIAFAKDMYDPHSKEGQRLIAHELVHVVQQRTHQAQSVVRRCNCRQVHSHARDPRSQERRNFESDFPQARGSAFCLFEGSLDTNYHDDSYNCYGYSARTREYWDQRRLMDRYSLPSEPFSYRILHRFFGAHGFRQRPAAHCSAEVLIYGTPTIPEHAATKRHGFQCPGISEVLYESKMGTGALVLHYGAAVNGGIYGYTSHSYEFDQSMDAIESGLYERPRQPQRPRHPTMVPYEESRFPQ